MAEVASGQVILRDFVRPARHPGWDATLRIVKNPVGFASLVVLVGLVLVAFFQHFFEIFGDPIASSRDVRVGPNAAHPFGTDFLGRDLAARVAEGAVISLRVGFIAAGVGVGIGSLVGLVTGYVGGWFDLVMQRVVDAFLSIPGIVLALFFAAVFNPSETTGIVAITIIIIPFNARVIRSAVLAVKSNVYVEAARAIGASNTRVMLRHILPNIVAPILIMVSTVLGAAILIEAGLAFLGMGAQEPTPSWGTMLQSSRRFLEISPHLLYFPALAISLTVLAFNMLGDVVRDVLDPRLRGSR